MGIDLTYFGLGGKSAVPALPAADTIAEAMTELVKAHDDLEDARTKVPSYTAQWDSKDYYAGEQERYNRAADRFHSIIDDMIRERIVDERYRSKNA